MSKRATFKQADVTRALRGADVAGLKVRECAIDPAGHIRLIFDDGSPVGPVNPLDRLLKP